jgi:uncharacterized protein YggE
MKSNGTRLLAMAGFAVAAALVFAAVTIGWVAPQGTAPASAQSQTETTRPSQITVRGTGSVSAKPDLIKMSVGVAQQDGTVKAAQAKVSATTDALVAKIKEAGVDEKDYRTSQYSVEPVMDFGYSGDKGSPNQTPKLTGFRVTNMLDITLRDPAKAPDLLDALTSAGASTIYNVNYAFADPDSLAKQAYDDAVKDAEVKATKLASLSKMQLGKIVSVTDSSANVPGPIYSGDMTGGKGGAGAIYPGQQSVQADVIVTYEAK